MYWFKLKKGSHEVSVCSAVIVGVDFINFVWLQTFSDVSRGSRVRLFFITLIYYFVLIFSLQTRVKNFFFCIKQNNKSWCCSDYFFWQSQILKLKFYPNQFHRIKMKRYSRIFLNCLRKGVYNLRKIDIGSENDWNKNVKMYVVESMFV